MRQSDVVVKARGPGLLPKKQRLLSESPGCCFGCLLPRGDGTSNCSGCAPPLRSPPTHRGRMVGRPAGGASAPSGQHGVRPVLSSSLLSKPPPDGTYICSPSKPWPAQHNMHVILVQPLANNTGAEALRARATSLPLAFPQGCPLPPLRCGTAISAQQSPHSNLRHAGAEGAAHNAPKTCLPSWQALTRLLLFLHVLPVATGRLASKVQRGQQHVPPSSCCGHRAHTAASRGPAPGQRGRGAAGEGALF